MSGLFGIIDLNPKSISEEEQVIAFTKMADTLRHHQEERVEQAHLSALNVMIGRVGLSGQNPIGWPTGTDDTKSGIQLFVSGPLLERGTQKPVSSLLDNTVLRQWSGFFSAVLTDPVHGVTLLVADHKASCPVFYAQNRDQLLFAPEVKAITASLLIGREIDTEAVATFLAQGYLLSDQTLFRSVRRLRGGELLRVGNGRVVKETYWRYLPGSASDGVSEADLEHELGQLLNTATQKHIGEPGKTVIFLSGGIDSRGILGGALAHVDGDGRKLNTISWGTGQGTRDSDVTVAASIARHLNTNHRFLQRKVSDYREHFRRVNYLIDGLSDVAAFHPYEYQLMVELRNSGYERALRGDEVFGLRHYSASTIEGASAIAYMQRLRGVRGLDAAIQGTYYDELCEASDIAIEKALPEARDLTPNQAKDFYYFSHRLQCYLHTGSYFRNIELDQRNVLLDDSILDFMAKVPDPLRIDKMLFRRAVKQEYPELARFPYAKRYDFEDWSKLLTTASPVREYVLEELNDRSSGIWQFLNPGALSIMLDELGKASGIRSMFGQWVNPKAIVKRGLEMFAPDLLSQIRSGRRARPTIHLGADKIIMRALVLKNWYDTFA